VPFKQFILFLFLLIPHIHYAQCPDCGNSAVDVGETNLNCPQDVAHDATCSSPCSQPTSFENTAGIRVAYDFVGTTTFGGAALPTGWTFAGAPSATTAGALPAADVFGIKGGLVQPNCSGSCTLTNYFCIGNLASNQAVGAGGTSGKLGANFDGRANVAANTSYAILRGQSNPTLVSPSYDMSAVNGFKVQFWLFPSETSCGLTGSWGSCVGNNAFLDFSADGGTTWTQIMIINLSSTNTDMCTNNSTNTKWLTESAWSRVCLTVFRNTTAEGNFYTAASGSTAASGMMVNSAYFTANFKFRIRYSQTASCTNATATNPGRYLAIDYPVVTSGNEMIPCGISFSKMCGYGLDNNDDGVGSSATSSTVVFGTTRRSVNQAERGVEILTSQSAAFASQNLTGSTFATNYDLCNAEGGDKQCIDWQSNNNFYLVVYECIADWEAASGTGINVQYYKGTTAQSTGMTKVTSVGKTALIGWRYSANRFVSCGSLSDLNPGCNGYSFLSGSLPTQFARGFYALATNSTGQSWPFYGATSCSHYFNGPFFSPIAEPAPDLGSPNFVVCNSGILYFNGLVDYCSTNTGMTGNATLDIVGPNGFTETINSGSTGVNPIVDAGDYYITANTPATPTQCLDCGKTVCVTISAFDINACILLPVELLNFQLKNVNGKNQLSWTTTSELNNDYYEIERKTNDSSFVKIGRVESSGNTNNLTEYTFLDQKPALGISYYRLKQVDVNGDFKYSKIISSNLSNQPLMVKPNPNNGIFSVEVFQENCTITLVNMLGETLEIRKNVNIGIIDFDLSNQENGIYFLKVDHSGSSQNFKIIKTDN
jgi:hypothetical protein